MENGIYKNLLKLYHHKLKTWYISKAQKSKISNGKIIKVKLLMT